MTEIGCTWFLHLINPGVLVVGYTVGRRDLQGADVATHFGYGVTQVTHKRHYVAEQSRLARKGVRSMTDSACNAHRFDTYPHGLQRRLHTLSLENRSCSLAPHSIPQYTTPNLWRHREIIGHYARHYWLFCILPPPRITAALSLLCRWLPYII